MDVNGFLSHLREIGYMAIYLVLSAVFIFILLWIFVRIKRWYGNARISRSEKDFTTTTKYIKKTRKPLTPTQRFILDKTGIKPSIEESTTSNTDSTLQPWECVLAIAIGIVIILLEIGIIWFVGIVPIIGIFLVVIWLISLISFIKFARFLPLTIWTVCLVIYSILVVLFYGFNSFLFREILSIAYR